jgi:glucose/arabinose dehydrogenase
MRRLLCALLLLAACTSTHTGTPSSDADLIATGVAGTLSAELVTSPQLLAPVDGATFDNPAGITLNWEWTRPLQGDERYDVRVWRGDDPHYGITWSDTSRFDMTDWLRHQPPGEYSWSVAVIVGGGDGQVERIVSSEAPPFRFTVRDMALPTPTRIPASDIVQVPPGFEARPYAQPELASLPTAITFGPDGMLYMLTYSGDIFAMQDTDGDQYAEMSQRIYLDDSEQLFHAVGLAFHDGVMYVSDSGKVSTFEDSDGDGRLDTFTPVVTGLVTLEYPDHSNNGIAFAPDGKLYIPVGAASDHGPVTSDMEGVILRVNPDGSDLEVFASGFRNPYDLAFSPEGELFTADNNPDFLDDTLHFLPPEELDFVREGRHYGFPDAFGFMNVGQDSEPPIVEFYPSVATAGLTYYSSDHFPPDYQNGLFVALWGTAAPTPQERSLTNGRMVVFVSLTPREDGGYGGEWRVFAWFRQGSDYRPIDAIVGDDGALYIAEWSTATVYRVTYEGGQAATAASETPTPEILPTAAPDVVALGESLYLNGAQDAPACVSCHRLDESPGLGPSLRGLRDVAGQRVSGQGAADYVRHSITNPNDYIVPGYNAGYMFQDYVNRLTADQLDALVAYVLSLEEE